MSPDPAERIHVDLVPLSDRHVDADASEDGDNGEPDAPPELMVVSRVRRSNAGNRMSTLLAKAAEEEQWGDEWEEAPNEEEFVGDDAIDQEDFNMDSSESDEGDDEGCDDDAGERELRKAERQERVKRRKTATNPFTARLAAAASRNKAKLHVSTESSEPAPRPKKKSERASWIPTEEDGPVRTSRRKQTVANKESTLARLKEKDKRRDDTLAMMKAAEARKAKHEPKPMTQAERLTEAARVERKNSKSLHRWEEAEEQRAADRQAKLDALKHRQIEGPFIRYYSGPAIWVDEKLKYTGKDAPKIEELEEKLNKEDTLEATQLTAGKISTSQVDLAEHNAASVDQTQTDQGPSQVPLHVSQPSHPSQSGTSRTLQAFGAPDPTGSVGVPYPNNTMFPSSLNDTFLYGIEQYASGTQTSAQPQFQTPHSQMHLPAEPQAQLQLPHNPFADYPQDLQFPMQSPFSQSHSLNSDATFSYSPHNHVDANSLLTSFQRPALPVAPPRRKVIRRALRNLLTLSSFSNLDEHIPSRSRTTSSILKDKDRSSLIHLSSVLFGWSLSDATTFVNAMTNQPKSTARKEREALSGLKVKRELCAVSNQIARYRDPGTGIAYRDARAFGILRGVVGGGYQWSGKLGCYVGARSSGGNGNGNGNGNGSVTKGSMSTQPAAGVPKRFLAMPKTPASIPVPADASVSGNFTAGHADVKKEDVGVA